MVESILTIIIASAIVGPAGYFLRTYLQDRWLPGKSQTSERSAYSFINRDWFVYHFTSDQKVSTKPVLATSTIKLTLKRHMLVEGTEETQIPDHDPLHYNLRGEIRAGQLIITGVCVEDPSDAYVCLFPNLIERKSVGISIGRDYKGSHYASPAVLSRKSLTESEVIQQIIGSGIRSFGMAYSEPKSNL